MPQPGVLLGPKTAEAVAQYFGRPQQVHGPGLLQSQRPRFSPGQTLHVMTPSGGIAARSAISGGETTYGAATCTIWKEVDVSGTIKGQATTETMTVYNDQLTAVGGDKLCQVKWIGGYPFIDVEPCP